MNDVVKLDPAKLLGFRLAVATDAPQGESDASAHVVTSSKIGAKDGFKTSSPELHTKIGSKIGEKAGTKFGAKIGGKFL